MMGKWVVLVIWFSFCFFYGCRSFICVRVLQTKKINE